VGGYRNLIFRHIAPHFETVALTILTEQRVRKFYQTLGENGLGQRSVWCVHLLLRRILDEACREGLIDTNPADMVTPPSGEEPQLPRLRSGQIKRYLEAAKEVDTHAIFYIGLASGLRQGELISLPWAVFGKERNRLVLPKRWVALSERAAWILTQKHDRHPESQLAFLDPKTGEGYTLHRFYYLHRGLLRRCRLPEMGFRELQQCAGEVEL